MMTGAIGRLLRLAAVAAVAGLAVGCASSQGPGSMTAPASFGKDPASRVARLVQYCDRLAEKGELVTALGLCGRAHEIDPDAPEPLMKVAVLLEKLGRLEAAAVTYTALLERHPTHHEALYSLGKLYMETGQGGLALVQFDRATRSDPKDPRPYNAMGILRDQAGEHEAAQGLYRLALERDPNNRSVRNNLGLSLALDGKRDEAIEVLAALAVDPEAGQTVMRNLEAAYASRTPSATAPIAEPLTEPSGPLADPLEPVASEPLEGAPAADAPAKDTPEPTAPAASGPMPLLPPPAGSAGAQQSDSRRPHVAPAPAGGSAILAAVEQLMQPPEWADFEPGSLLGAGPSASEAAERPAAEVESDAGAAAPDVTGESEAFGLSMLVTEAGATVA